MSVNPNQFVQSIVKGMMDLKSGSAPFVCLIASSVTTPLVPGQAVKLADVAGKHIIVEPISADTDEIFGFIAYNTKQASFGANEAVEIAGGGCVIYLEASAAAARGASIMAVVADSKIAVATAGKVIGGIVIDKPAADGDLVRVKVADPVNKLVQA